MAKIEIIQPENKDIPASIEIIEVRPWGLGGTKQQTFYIGGGANFQANGNIWLEIIYTVEGAQLLYTRNFLHHYSYHEKDDLAASDSRLDELLQKGEGKYGFGDMLPETRIVLTAEKMNSPFEIDEGKQFTSCKLEISADTGAVFGRDGPGDRSIDIRMPLIEMEEGVRFMRELSHEIEAVRQGKHPDPACFPEGSSEWPFVWQLNRRAYNKISEHYREEYFENPALAEAFDGWLARVPPGGQILDAGCGHGEPVIARLLEKGFQVTGSDFSPEMLRRASQQFPEVTFINQATTALTQQAAFDGACSFSSMLYMDPIDLLHSIYRLHCALKPGGLLFLFAYDTGPDWRGEPFHQVIGQWMWSWHYGMEEAAHLLEEHGYFEVLETRKVIVDEGEDQRIAQELEKQKVEEEEYRQKQASHPGAIPLPFFKTPIKRSAYAYLISARRGERG